MRALSLWQPWASAIALGIKTVETRSWSTKYRGPLLIHATQRFPREAREFAETERALGRLPARLPLGAVVAVATLADVRPAEEVALEASAIERLYGDYTPGRWAWMLADVRALSEPIPASGGQGIWRPSDMLEGDVSDALVEDGGGMVLSIRFTREEVQELFDGLVGGGNIVQWAKAAVLAAAAALNEEGGDSV